MPKSNTPAQSSEPRPKASPARLAANQANALLSTGPVTTTGKATSKMNALKTGLTGRTVLLPEEDLAAYTAHVAAFTARYQPVGDDETHLVQSLADTEWRLLRIPSLEMGIYALGRLELADQFPDEEESVRRALIEAKIFMVYQRQLNNLSIQENRLRRQREKDLVALGLLHQGRSQPTNEKLDQAAKSYTEAVRRDSEAPFDPAALGFEFSLANLAAQSELGHYDRKPRNGAGSVSALSCPPGE